MAVGKIKRPNKIGAKKEIAESFSPSSVTKDNMLEGTPRGASGVGPAKPIISAPKPDGTPAVRTTPIGTTLGGVEPKQTTPLEGTPTKKPIWKDLYDKGVRAEDVKRYMGEDIEPFKPEVEPVTTGTAGVGTTGITGKPGTPFDINKDGMLNENELTGDYKTFYDTLSDTEKKLFLAEGEKALQQNLDITETYAKYMRDYETTRGRREQDEAYRLKQEGISKEMAGIRESQTLKRTKEGVDKLKQSIAYLGDRGMPGVSAERVRSIAGLIENAEQSYADIQRLTQLGSRARNLQSVRNAQGFERQMEDMMTRLNDDIDKQIQTAYNELRTADDDGKLETVEELTAFRDKMYQDLDSRITGFIDPVINQMKFLINRVDQAKKEALQYEEKTNQVNTEMSQVQGYYVDDNGEPIISATTGQRIQIPQEPPMEPIFDKNTGQMITFSTDENGQIVGTTHQIVDQPSFEESTISNYASLVASGKLDMNDVPEQIRTSSSFVQGLAQAPAQRKEEFVGTWKEMDDGRYVNTTTMEVRDVPPVGGLGTLDFTTNTSLINKYPREASFKNNNPTGMTWGISNTLKNMFDEAGVQYSKGTSRPAAEGGSYIKFATVEDGMKAYRIALTQRGEDVYARLKQWVGTAEGPTYANNLMRQAGIERGAKFSDLSENQITKLMDAQLRKESPNFHREMGKITTSPKVDVDSLAFDITSVLPRDLYKTDADFDRVTKRVKKAVKDLQAKGETPTSENVANILRGWDIKEGVDTVRANELKDVLQKNAGETDRIDWATVSGRLNAGDYQGAENYVRNIVEERAKKHFGEDFITTVGMNENSKVLRKLADLINKNPDKIGAFDGKVTEFMKKFRDEPEMQELQTLLTMSQAQLRKKFAGSAVTPEEMRVLEDYVGGNIKMTPNNLLTMLNVINEKMESEYIGQRQKYGYSPKGKDQFGRVKAEGNSRKQNVQKLISGAILRGENEQKLRDYAQGQGFNPNDFTYGSEVTEDEMKAMFEAGEFKTQNGNVFSEEEEALISEY